MMLEVDVPGLVILTAVVFVLLHIYFYVKHVLELKNFPMGPIPLPIVGNLLSVRGKPYKYFADLSKKYGDVFSISFGMRRYVVVNSYQEIKEALVTKGDVFCGRPSDLFTNNLISRGGQDLIFSDHSHHQRELKQSCHKLIRQCNQDTFHENIANESQSFHRRIETNEKEGLAISLGEEIDKTVINILLKTFITNTPTSKQVSSVDTMNKCLLSGLSDGDLSAIFPWLRHLPQKSISAAKRYVELRSEFFESTNKDNNDTTDASDLLLSNLLLAGNNTTSMSLQWALIYLSTRPDYQDAIYEEVVKAVANVKRYACWEDKCNMGFLQACIQETMRLSSVAPLGMAHKTTQETTLKGMKLQKGTNVIFNLWNIHHDEKYWDHPNDFNPSRWMDEEGNFCSHKHKLFLPFSAGRRACPGQLIATKEIFLVLGRFFRDFKLEPCNNKVQPTEGIYKLVNCPPNYMYTIKKRDK